MGSWGSKERNKVYYSELTILTRLDSIIQPFIIGCVSALPQMRMVLPVLAGVTSYSATIKFETAPWNFITKPTGYQLQYHAKSTSQWVNGSRMTHAEWPDSNTTHTLRSFYITQNELDEGVHYRIRVVPLLLYNGIYYQGVPSKQLYVTTPHGMYVNMLFSDKMRLNIMTNVLSLKSII